MDYTATAWVAQHWTTDELVAAIESGEHCSETNCTRPDRCVVTAGESGVWPFVRRE